MRKEMSAASTLAVMACGLFVLVPSTWAMTVFPHNGAGDKYPYDTGDAEVVESDISWWDNRYPYMATIEGHLESGTGMGYWSTDVSWYTDADEVDGATSASIKWEVDYDEDGDETGESNAYVYRSFRVYQKSGSSWSLVGESTNNIWIDYIGNPTYQVNHDFDDSEYKFRFIFKMYFCEESITQDLQTEIWDERHDTGAGSTHLYVSD